MPTSAVLQALLCTTTLAGTLATEATFQLGEVSSNTCSDGLHFIGSAPACEAAAAALGLTYTSAGSFATYSTGCYQFLGNGGNQNKVFFNTHSTGAASADSKPICTDKMYVEALRYKFGVADSNTCGGFAFIQNEEGCQAAANYLGLTFAGSGAYASYPAGCWQSLAAGGNQNKLFFNTAAQSAKNAQGKVVCTDKFYIDEPNLLTCSAGLAGVSTASRCRMAAAALGLEFSAETTHKAYPSGCFKFMAPGSSDENKVFFNAEAETGEGHANARVICQDAFVEQNAVTQDCAIDRGEEPIDSATMCESAAATLGVHFGGTETSDTRPKGCHRTTSAGVSEPQLFFNDHASGAAGSGSATVCQQAFVTLQVNTKDCSGDSDHSDIHSEAVCRSAAAAFGNEFASAGAFPSYSSGCFRWLGAGANQNKLFYNVEFAGQASADTAPVCAREAKTTTTLQAKGAAVLVDTAAGASVGALSLAVALAAVAFRSGE